MPDGTLRAFFCKAANVLNAGVSPYGAAHRLNTARGRSGLLLAFAATALDAEASPPHCSPLFPFALEL